MVEVNWKGIARTAKALGGEGMNYLLLKTKQQVDEGTLDAALPAVEEGPDNGGWFLGPQGWMLLIEGPDEQVNPWIVQLADRLTAAGIEGTLTGAGVAAPPMWCRGDWDSRGLHANLALQPRADARALDVGLGWLTGHGGKVLVSTGWGYANFWVAAEAARGILIEDAERRGSGFSTNYNQARLEVSHLIVNDWGLELIRAAADWRWGDIVADFRDALVAAPLDRVSYASVSHQGMGTLLNADIPGSESDARVVYRSYPERWDEVVLQPCGIQILTDRHLEAANDLSGWRTTRLDDSHVLVEARDLEPWYATRRRPHEQLDPQLMALARHDFGAMILTLERAKALGLTA